MTLNVLLLVGWNFCKSYVLHILFRNKPGGPCARFASYGGARSARSIALYLYDSNPSAENLGMTARPYVQCTTFDIRRQLHLRATGNTMNGGNFVSRSEMEKVMRRHYRKICDI